MGVNESEAKQVCFCKIIRRLTVNRVEFVSFFGFIFDSEHGIREMSMKSVAKASRKNNRSNGYYCSAANCSNNTAENLDLTIYHFLLDEKRKYKLMLIAIVFNRSFT